MKDGLICQHYVVASAFNQRGIAHVRTTYRPLIDTTNTSIPPSDKHSNTEQKTHTNLGKASFDDATTAVTASTRFTLHAPRYSSFLIPVSTTD